MTCRELTELLADFLDAALPQPTAALVGRHLAACPECRAYAGSYRLTIGLERAAYRERDDETDELPAELTAAILAARGAELAAQPPPRNLGDRKSPGQDTQDRNRYG
jgi:anti-sigma factor RsiW